MAAKDPPRTLRWLSTGSGLLLIIGGISGVFTINPLAMVISVYNILFGGLIVLTELKSWPIIRTFQKQVDVYFHLLSIPRGKGGFYCFIGFLAFFSSEWSLARVCVLIVSIIGVVHLLHCKRCGATDEGGQAAGAANIDGTQPIEYAESGSCEAGGEGPSWAGLMKTVVGDNPEVASMAINAGIQYAVSGGGTAAAASGGSGSGSAAAPGSSSDIDGVPASTMKN